MYTIGQFSIITEISKKTLRYYDEIDLFKPIFIKKENQYRYYSEQQIDDALLLKKYKEVGIPLSNIKKLLLIDNDKNFDILNERIDIIDQSIYVLNSQKESIKNYLVNSSKLNLENTSYKIEKGKYIKEGIIVYKKILSEYNNVNKYISDFYYEFKDVELTSKHIFRRNINDDISITDEIFAYTSCKTINDNMKYQQELLCLKMLCNDISKRSNAYSNVFNYIKKNKLNVGDIFEMYSINNGKLSLEIVFELITNN